MVCDTTENVEASPAGAVRGKRRAKKVRVYGVWMISSPRALKDVRIWKEDRLSYALPTRFQRAAGVRYRRTAGRLYPDSSGGYGQHRQRKDSPWKLLQGYDSTRPPTRQALRLRAGHLAPIRTSTGHVYLWAPHLRLDVPAPGLHLVATLRVRATPDDA